MTRRPPDPIEVVTSRREAALARLVAGVPYIGFLGARFDSRGDELTAILPFHPSLIGNPLIPALHGGATAAFLEVTAIVTLAWTTVSNAAYRVEFKTDLGSTNWSEIFGDVTVLGNTASKLDALTSSNRFYRVRVLP